MSDNSVEEFLAHYGTKGMKWGVRRKSGGSSSSSTVSSTKTSGRPAWQSPPAKKVAPSPPPSSKAGKRVRLGKNKRPKVYSEEAAQIRDIRLKAKKQGVQSLTNKELELINKRIELQNKYTKAYPKKNNPLIDLAIDAVLSDQGAKKINDIMVAKKINKNMIGVVEAAIALNKVARQKK